MHLGLNFERALTYAVHVHGGHVRKGTLLQAYGGGARPLYSFYGQDNCADGSSPEGDLTADRDDNLFGTTLFGGANGQGGTVFELMP